MCRIPLKLAVRAAFLQGLRDGLNVLQVLRVGDEIAPECGDAVLPICGDYHMISGFTPQRCEMSDCSSAGIRHLRCVISFSRPVSIAVE